MTTAVPPNTKDVKYCTYCARKDIKTQLFPGKNWKPHREKVGHYCCDDCGFEQDRKHNKEYRETHQEKIKDYQHNYRQHNSIGRPKQEYYIDYNIHPKPAREFPMRIGQIVSYRALLSKQHRTRPLYRQLYAVMRRLKETEKFVYIGEVIAALRKQLSTDPPTKTELNRLDRVLLKLRREIGEVLQAMVCYKTENVQGKTILRPLKDKDEYLDVKGFRMRAVAKGILDMHKSNMEILSLPNREIEKRLQEIDMMFEEEAEGFNRSKKSKRRGTRK